MHSLPPEGADMEFQHGGFYVTRDGWRNDSTVAIINSGRHSARSAAHAHSDAMSFELAAAGRQWLVDPGTFTYTGSSKARDEFRSGLSHNVAMVDGVSCSLPDGPFRWRTLAHGDASQFNGGRVLSYFRGSHDGYRRLQDPVEYARQFALIRPSSPEAGGPSYVVVSDDFLSTGLHSYQVNFIFDPLCSVAADGGRLVARHDDGGRLDVFVHGYSAVDSCIRDGFVSACYGERRSAPAVLFRSAGTALHQMVSIIVPSSADMESSVDFRRDGAHGCVEVIVDSPVCQDMILVANSLRRPGSACDRLNGSMGLVRRRLGLLETVALVDGDRFETDGICIFSSTVLEHCEVSVNGDSAEVRVQGAGRSEVEIRIGGQCLHLETARRQRGQVLFRRFDLARAAVQSTGK